MKATKAVKKAVKRPKQVKPVPVKERVNPCHVCDCMYPCGAARSQKPWD